MVAAGHPSGVTAGTAQATSQRVELWTVQPGESFWSIAEEHLGDVWDVETLTDEQIVSYWKPLIAANEDRLVDPGNPDLLLPGQELRLPTAPDAP